MMRMDNNSQKCKQDFGVSAAKTTGYHDYNSEIPVSLPNNRRRQRRRFALRAATLIVLSFFKEFKVSQRKSAEETKRKEEMK